MLFKILPQLKTPAGMLAAVSFNSRTKRKQVCALELLSAVVAALPAAPVRLQDKMFFTISLLLEISAEALLNLIASSRKAGLKNRNWPNMWLIVSMTVSPTTLASVCKPMERQCNLQCCEDYTLKTHCVAQMRKDDIGDSPSILTICTARQRYLDSANRPLKQICCESAHKSGKHSFLHQL